MSTTVDRRTRRVAVGTGWALAVALPAALLAQAADAATSGGGTSPLVVPCVVVVLGGLVLGGWAVGRDPGSMRGEGAVAALAAVTVVQLLGLVRQAILGHHIAWATLPFVLALGAGLGAGGSTLGRRRPGRTRP